MPGINLDGILAAMTQGAAQSNAQIDQVIQSQTAAIDQMTKLMAENQQQAQVAIQRGAEVGAQQAEINYRQNLAKEQAQQLANMNPEQQQNELAKSLAAISEAEIQRVQVREKVDKITETNFFDNPVGYILGRMELPSLVAKNNNLVDQKEVANATFNMRADMLNKFNTVTTAATAEAVRKKEYDSLAVQQQQAQIKLRESEIQNLSALGQQKMQLANLTDKKWDNQSKVFTTAISVAQFKEAQAERAEARAERLAMQRERLANKKTMEEAKSRLDAGLANLSETLGLIGADGKPLINSVETLKLSVKNQKQFDSWQSAAATQTMGDGFADSLAFFDSNQNRNYIAANRPLLAQATAGLKNGVLSTVNSLRKLDPATGKVPPEKQIMAEAPEMYAADILGSSALSKNQKFTLTDARYDGGYFNPYRANHAIMLETVRMGGAGAKQLEGNVMFQAIKATADAQKNGGKFKGADEQLAFKTVAQQVADRKITPADASAQISAYYAAATKLTGDAYGTTTIFNLPRQTSYAVTVPIPGLLYGSNPLNADLLNRASVENALTKYVKDQKSGPVGNPELRAIAGF